MMGVREEGSSSKLIKGMDFLGDDLKLKTVDQEQAYQLQVVDFPVDDIKTEDKIDIVNQTKGEKSSSSSDVKFELDVFFAECLNS